VVNCTKKVTGPVRRKNGSRTVGKNFREGQVRREIQREGKRVEKKKNEAPQGEGLSSRNLAWVANHSTSFNPGIVKGKERPNTD